MAVWWPSGEPIDRSPSGERSTKRGRSVGRALDAGARMHRPDVSERVRAGPSDWGGGVVLLSPDPRQSDAFVGTDGADDASFRGRLGGVCQARGGGPDPLRARGTQGRTYEGVCAPVARRRGGVVHRQGAGACPGASHRTAPRPGDRRALSVAGRLHGDGQPQGSRFAPRRSSTTPTTSMSAEGCTSSRSCARDGRRCSTRASTSCSTI